MTPLARLLVREVASRQHHTDIARDEDPVSRLLAWASVVATLAYAIRHEKTIYKDFPRERVTFADLVLTVSDLELHYRKDA